MDQHGPPLRRGSAARRLPGDPVAAARGDLLPAPLQPPHVRGERLVRLRLGRGQPAEGLDRGCPAGARDRPGTVACGGAHEPPAPRRYVRRRRFRRRSLLSARRGRRAHLLGAPAAYEGAAVPRLAHERVALRAPRRLRHARRRARAVGPPVGAARRVHGLGSRLPRPGRHPGHRLRPGGRDRLDCHGHRGAANGGRLGRRVRARGGSRGNARTGGVGRGRDPRALPPAAPVGAGPAGRARRHDARGGASWG